MFKIAIIYIRNTLYKYEDKRTKQENRLRPHDKRENRRDYREKTREKTREKPNERVKKHERKRETEAQALLHTHYILFTTLHFTLLSLKSEELKKISFHNLGSLNRPFFFAFKLAL